MARLRFPGRPGYRFDRLGVRYGADEAKNITDPTLVIVANIHRGLRHFRELFGESDEDEDFEGFTLREVRQSEKKLAIAAAAELASSTKGSRSPVEQDYVTGNADGNIGTRFERAKKSLASLPASERTRAREKTIIRKSYKDLITQGLAKPTKLHFIVKVKDVDSSKKVKMVKKGKVVLEKTAFKHKDCAKLKKIKIRLQSNGEQAKIVKKRGRPSLSELSCYSDRGDDRYELPFVRRRGRPSKMPSWSDGDVHSKTMKKKWKRSNVLKVKMGHKLFHEKSEKRVKIPKEDRSTKKKKVLCIPKSKKVEKSLAKQLLAKAKQKKQKMSPQSRLTTPHNKKIFVLPTVSSRSSRVIIPNKRFLLEESMQHSAPKRQKMTDSGEMLDRSFTTLAYKDPNILSPTKSPEAMSESFSAGAPGLFFSNEQRQSLLDSPLLREGKRCRKPSMKIRMIAASDEGSTNDDVMSPPRANNGAALSSPTRLFSPFDKHTSPIMNLGPFSPKHELFSTSSPSETMNKKRIKGELFEKEAEAMKRSGNSILRKAKLQLNRVAINRSKAALARSLKAKIKREAKQEREKELRSPTSPTIVVVSPMLTDSISSPLVSPNRKGHSIGKSASKMPLGPCVICGNRKLRWGSGLLHGVPCCESCRKFDRYWSAKAASLIPVCQYGGDCIISSNTKDGACVACRSQRCKLSFHSKKSLIVPHKSVQRLKRPKKIYAKQSVDAESIQEDEENYDDENYEGGASEMTESSPESVSSLKARGPRIKHVCRKAAVVLGKQRAVFSKRDKSQLCLSALPRKDKDKLLKKEEENKALLGLSDDELPMEEIIRNSENKDIILSPKRTSFKHISHITMAKKEFAFDRPRKRKIRCKKCEGCLREDCGKCVYCLDKVKFGGVLKLKQACIHRVCSNRSTTSFIRPKLVNKSQNVPDPAKESLPDVPVVTLSRPTDTFLPKSSGNEAAETVSEQPRNNPSPLAVVSEPSIPTLPPFMPTGKRLPTKFKEKAVTTMKTHPAIIQPVLAPPRTWPVNHASSIHLLLAQYKESCDIKSAWHAGISLTMSSPTCLRSVCYLCGASGKHELIYCTVCCEPYHEFCLEEDEEPKNDDLENWCCKRCQFCNVCGRQYNLLQCDRCQNTYHPECLGPNYPTKPSKKKNIWVCTKCVRCKSCGATTPGNKTNATWTYDFSLCHECGQLMDKGNFCPICHKCYSDDDWDSHMVQCSVCESWVHAKCEGLNDEMYQLLSYAPDDVVYKCKMCTDVQPANWEITLRRQMQIGMMTVLAQLLSSKCAQHLKEHKTPPKKSTPPVEPRTPPREVIPKAHKEFTEGNNLCAEMCNARHVQVQNSEQLACDELELVLKDCDVNDKSYSNNVCPDSRCDENGCQVETLTSMNTDLKCDKQCSTTETNAQTHIVQSVPDNTNTQTCSAQPVYDNPNAQINNAQFVDDNCITIDDSCDEDMVTALECDNKEKDDVVKCKTDVAECDKGNCKDIALHDDNKVCKQILTNENARDTMHKNYNKCNEVSPPVISPGNEFKNRHWMDFLGNEETSEAASATKSCVKKLINDHDNDSMCNDPQAMDVDDENTWKLEYCDSPAGADTTDIMHGDIDNTNASFRVPTGKSNCETDISEKKDSEVSKQATESSETNMDHISSMATTNSEGIKGATESSANEASVATTITTDSEVCKQVTEAFMTTVDEDPWKLEYSTSSDEDDGERNATNVSADDHKNVITRQNCEQSKDASITSCSVPSATSHSDILSTNDCQKINVPDKRARAGEMSSVEINANVQSDNLFAQSTKTNSFDIESRDNLLKTEGERSVSSSQTYLSQVAPAKVVIMHDTGTSCDNFEEESKKGSTLSLTEHCYFKKSGPLRAHTHVQFTSTTVKRPPVIADHPKDFSTIQRKLLDYRYKTIGEFSEDMVRIIQAALSDPDPSCTVTRKKANVSVRSVFIKQMEKSFPWLNVSTCSLWEQNRKLPVGMLPDAVLPPSEDHTYAQWMERLEQHLSPQPSPFKKMHNTPMKKVVPMASLDDDTETASVPDVEPLGEDVRRCVLCYLYGDQNQNDAGRLLYAGQDDWVHVNCALWSAEVFEESDGSLQNVHEALSRGKKMRCDWCNRTGATVGCCQRGCPSNYHFMCARANYCVFQEDKKVFCRSHRTCTDGDLVSPTKFSVLRRTCIDMNNIRYQKVWQKGLNPLAINVVIGSCTVESLGHLAHISDQMTGLVPVEFSCTRMYWSTQDSRRRCIYTCRVVEVKPNSPTMTEIAIKDTRIVHDERHPDYVPFEDLDLQGINLFPKNIVDIGNNDLHGDTSIIEMTSLLKADGISAEYEKDRLFNSSDTISVNSDDRETFMNLFHSDMKTAVDKTMLLRIPELQTDPMDMCDSTQSKNSSGSNKITSLQKSRFGALSPNTLKCLNVTDHSRIVIPEDTVADDFCNLTGIVDRLNNAASKFSRRKSTESGNASGRSSRSSSVERNCRMLTSPVPENAVHNFGQVSWSTSKQTVVHGQPSLGTASTNSHKVCVNAMAASNRDQLQESSVPPRVGYEDGKCSTVVEKLLDVSNLLDISDDQAENEKTDDQSTQNESLLDLSDIEIPAELAENADTFVVIQGQEDVSDDDIKYILKTLNDSCEIWTEEAAKDDGTSEETIKNEGTHGNELQDDGIQAKDDGIQETATKDDGIQETATKDDGIPETATKDDGIQETATKDDGIQETATKDDGIQETATKDDGIQETATKDDGVQETATKDDVIQESAMELDGIHNALKGDGDMLETSAMQVVTSKDDGIHESATSSKIHTDDNSKSQPCMKSLQAPGMFDIKIPASSKSHIVKMESASQVTNDAGIGSMTRDQTSFEIHQTESDGKSMDTITESSESHWTSNQPSIPMLKKSRNYNSDEKLGADTESECRTKPGTACSSKDFKAACLSVVKEIVNNFGKNVSNTFSVNSSPKTPESKVVDSSSNVCRLNKCKSPPTNKIACDDDGSHREYREEGDVKIPYYPIPVYGKKGEFIGHQIAFANTRHLKKRLLEVRADRSKTGQAAGEEERPNVESKKQTALEKNIEIADEMSKTPNMESKKQTTLIPDETSKTPNMESKKQTTLEENTETTDETSKTPNVISKKQTTLEENTEIPDETSKMPNMESKKQTSLEENTEIADEKTKTTRSKSVDDDNVLGSRERISAKDVIATSPLSASDLPTCVVKLDKLIGDVTDCLEVSGSTLKTYPLRRGKRRHSTDLEGQGRSATIKSRRANICSNVSEHLPIHDKVAQKIKETSLAKSSPEDRGPFKCPTCKRMYRTRESFNTHVEKCDFEVSTSEDEEEPSNNASAEKRFSMRGSTLLQRQAMAAEKRDRELMSVANKVLAGSEDKDEPHSEGKEKSTPRFSLRTNTLVQRQAMESEVRQRASSGEEHTKRGGRKRFFSGSDKIISQDTDSVLAKENEVDVVVKRKRGRPRTLLYLCEISGKIIDPTKPDVPCVKEVEPNRAPDGDTDMVSSSCRAQKSENSGGGFMNDNGMAAPATAVTGLQDRISNEQCTSEMSKSVVLIESSNETETESCKQVDCTISPPSTIANIFEIFSKNNSATEVISNKKCANDVITISDDQDDVAVTGSTPVDFAQVASEIPSNIVEEPSDEKKITINVKEEITTFKASDQTNVLSPMATVVSQPSESYSSSSSSTISKNLSSERLSVTIINVNSSKKLQKIYPKFTNAEAGNKIQMDPKPSNVVAKNSKQSSKLLPESSSGWLPEQACQPRETIPAAVEGSTCTSSQTNLTVGKDVCRKTGARKLHHLSSPLVSPDKRGGSNVSTTRVSPETAARLGSAIKKKVQEVNSSSERLPGRPMTHRESVDKLITDLIHKSDLPQVSTNTAHFQAPVAMPSVLPQTTFQISPHTVTYMPSPLSSNFQLSEQQLAIAQNQFIHSNQLIRQQASMLQSLPTMVAQQTMLNPSIYDPYLGNPYLHGQPQVVTPINLPIQQQTLLAPQCLTMNPAHSQILPCMQQNLPSMVGSDQPLPNINYVGTIVMKSQASTGHLSSARQLIPSIQPPQPSITNSHSIMDSKSSVRLQELAAHAQIMDGRPVTSSSKNVIRVIVEGGKKKSDLDMNSIVEKAIANALPSVGRPKQVSYTAKGLDSNSALNLLSSLSSGSLVTSSSAGVTTITVNRPTNTSCVIERSFTQKRLAVVESTSSVLDRSTVTSVTTPASGLNQPCLRMLIDSIPMPRRPIISSSVHTSMSPAKTHDQQKEASIISPDKSKEAGALLKKFVSKPTVLTKRNVASGSTTMSQEKGDVIKTGYIVKDRNGIVKTRTPNARVNLLCHNKVLSSTLHKAAVVMSKFGANSENAVLEANLKMLQKGPYIKKKPKQPRKSVLKPRTLPTPHSAGTIHSHPILLHQKELSVLPVPELEEEITDSPMQAVLDRVQRKDEPDPPQRVQKEASRLVFEVTSDDGFHCTGPTMDDVWQQVTEKVQDARNSARMKQLSFQNINGASIFGISHSAVIYLLEQLYGARNCRNYKFRYQRHSKPHEDEEEPFTNPSGCIKTEPFVSRKPYDMFSFLMSEYRIIPEIKVGKGDTEMVHKSSRRATSLGLPMAMRFRHLQGHAREAVGVYRSPIHGRGLFCKRAIDNGEMIIEYAGEVIRAALTDKREKYYESKGIGCYMFRIDDIDVVDATMHGNDARFINHSCEPNCFSKVIQVDGKKHIVIFAMRPITRGEELTYDYKFPIEEVKIPCMCASKKCRKYLN